MKVALITVDYNGHSDTAEFLKSAKKLVIPKGVELKTLVVDNGSDEPLKEDVEILQTGTNLGFAGGYNFGARYALSWGADYLFIVNNDVIFQDKNLLVSLLETAVEKEAGVVAPKILFAPGYEFHKDRYQKDDRVIWYAGGHIDWENVMSVHRGLDEIDQGQYDRVEETEFVSGCCMLVLRETWIRSGGFEEKLFAYFEDSAFNQGVKKFYDGRVNIQHKVSQTAGIGSDFTDYLLTRNRLYFGFKYAGTRAKFALLREAIRFLLTGRPKQRQGVMDFFQNKYGKPDFTISKPSKNFSLKLSVVIINYKTLDLTLKCIETVDQYLKDGEIILIDNGSGDGIIEIVNKRFPDVKTIANEKNLGFSAANNQGIDYSRGEYILLLNSDTEARKNSFTELISAADKLNGITGGKLFFPDGSDQDSCFNLPTVTHALEEYFLNKKGSYFMFQPQGIAPTQVEGLVMACFMIPRWVITQIGKLDEGTFMYFEDVEYCRRLRDNNIPLYFVPQSEFVHHHGASSKVIGHSQAYSLLKKGSVHYHGRLKYAMLWAVLWLGQKLSFVTSPKSRWNS